MGTEIMRPVTGGTVSNWNPVANPFQQVNEVSPNDSNFVESNDGENEVRFQMGPGISGNYDSSMLRFRSAKLKDGIVSSDGNEVQLICRIIEGGGYWEEHSPLFETQITVNGGWNQNDIAVNLSGVQNWSNISVCFKAVSSKGGNPARRRNAGVSWVELEVTTL